MTGSAEVEVQGRRLRLSNLDKVLYPRAGYTKADVINYYTRIAPALLPHLRDRPLTLKRYPEGVDRDYFYEKNCPAYRPSWFRTVAVWSEGNARDVNYCVVNDLPSLVWLANLADIELHTSLSLARDVEEPTVVAFDLDPGAPAGLRECAQVALWLRELFAELTLDCCVKTSGSKGMQVYLPLNTPVRYDDTKPFAHEVARTLERSFPAQVVSSMKKSLRPGKVFIDWSQNDAHKTTVCAYSLRARDKPSVSTPLAWAEVERLHGDGDVARVQFTPEEVLARVERSGDLFSPVLTRQQHLPRLHR